jgi:alkyl hydroperoxide reductase subunit AhpC
MRIRRLTPCTHEQGRFVLLSDVRYGKVVVGQLHLSVHFRDFTFVCPTEILAFNDALGQFKELNTEVLAVSTDSQYSHFSWANQPRKEGGLGPDLRLPLLADRNMKISRDYGVLIEEMGIALRGLFVIDPQGILRYVFRVAH